VGRQFRGGILTTSGLILRQDHYLIQEMQAFNRERVPEPVVHAKGGGAFGYSQVTADVTPWTKATDGCSDAITV
jgi:catalase